MITRRAIREHSAPKTCNKMEINNRSRTVLLATAAVLGSLCAAAVQAGTQTVELVRSSLTNVPDAAGIYQYEGGTLENSSGGTLGNYIIVRRTEAATASFNTAATTITLFLPPATSGAAPSVVTLEGAWSFSSGDFQGSVSAASNKFHWLVGADAASSMPTVSASKLVLTWAGSNELIL